MSEQSNTLTDDPTALWAEIYRLRAALKGPEGYATWQDAALDERLKRIDSERALTAAEQKLAELSAEFPDVESVLLNADGFDKCGPEIRACVLSQAAQIAALHSASEHWNGLYRAQCLKRQDDAARYGQQIVDLDEQIAALTRDAERYCYLRDRGVRADIPGRDCLLVYQGADSECSLLPEELDEAIDKFLTAKGAK